MNKIFIVDDSEGIFSNTIGKYIPTLKCSILDLPKEAAKVLGWDGDKTEKDRRFLSDIMGLSTDYNDAPFKDVLSLVTDFKNNKDYAEYKVLIIDMRDPKDIARAVKTFGADTILIRNPNVKKINSNHADRDVENYEYDYIIENNGTLEQLDEVAKRFVNYIKNHDNQKFPSDAYCLISHSGKKTIVFECNKMLR